MEKIKKTHVIFLDNIRLRAAGVRPASRSGKTGVGLTFKMIGPILSFKYY
jgi:hypothetical protein